MSRCPRQTVHPEPLRVLGCAPSAEEGEAAEEAGVRTAPPGLWTHDGRGARHPPHRPHQAASTWGRPEPQPFLLTNLRSQAQP